MSVVSIIISIIMLGILVLVHEFGHFVLARKNGIFVKEFSIGFGPRIISKVAKSGTRFSWKAIPFGGSCLMLGQMEDEDEGTDDEKSFNSKSVWARMSVILAGPFFNIFLAFVLSVIYVSCAGYDPSVVTAVDKNSSAYEAGIREGDLITSYNGVPVTFGRDVYLEQYVSPVSVVEDQVKMTLERNGEKFDVVLHPEEKEYYRLGLSYYANEDPAAIENVTEGTPIYDAGMENGDTIVEINGTAINTGKKMAEYFSKYDVGKDPVKIKYMRRGAVRETEVTPVRSTSLSLGFSYNMANVKTDVWGCFKYSFAEIGYQVKSVFKSLGLLFSPRGSLDMLSGPVGIVEVIGSTYDQSVKIGFFATIMNLLSIMILLSANLGVVNMFPIPAMDGGKFILLIIEAITRKPINRKVETVVTFIGAGLLVVLAAVVLINDITKFF